MQTLSPLRTRRADPLWTWDPGRPGGGSAPRRPSAARRPELSAAGVAVGFREMPKALSLFVSPGRMLYYHDDNVSLTRYLWKTVALAPRFRRGAATERYESPQGYNCYAGFDPFSRSPRLV